MLIQNGFSRKNPPKKSKKKKKGLDELDDPESDEDESEDEIDFSYVIDNYDLFEITGAQNLSDFYRKQQKSWVAHIIRQENSEITKQLLFEKVRNKKRGPKKTILNSVLKQNQWMGEFEFYYKCFNREIM